MATTWVKQEVGKRIKSLRKSFGYSQEQLAQLIGLSRTSVMNIESGRHGLPIEGIYTMCRILKCTPNDLFPSIKSVRVESRERVVVIKKTKTEFKPVKR